MLGMYLVQNKAKSRAISTSVLLCRSFLGYAYAMARHRSPSSTPTKASNTVFAGLGSTNFYFAQKLIVA